MADVKYTVEFKQVDEISSSGVIEQTPSDKTDTSLIRDKNPKKNEQIGVGTKLNTKAWAKFMTGYGVYQIADDLHHNLKITDTLSRGDNLQAVMQSERRGVRGRLTGTAVNLAGGFAIGNLAGLGIAAGMEVYRYAREAINIGIDNRRRLDQLLAERHVANQEQERFVRNATTEAIRSW